MAYFLGIFPRPIGDEAIEWDLKFENKMIQRDGFVEEKHRFEFRLEIQSSKDYNHISYF